MLNSSIGGQHERRRFKRYCDCVFDDISNLLFADSYVGLVMYKDFLFIVGVMIMALLYMLGFKILALIVIAITAYFLNKQPNKPLDEDEDEIRYGCPTDYRAYNRNKDFLDE